MKVEVLLFGAARQAVGEERTVFELPEGASARELLQEAVRRYPSLGPMAEFLKVAVNRKVEGLDVTLSEGDEVALLPPMGGGHNTFDLAAEPVNLDQVRSDVEGPGVGAVVLFVGRVREVNRGRPVVALEYEAYEDMAVERMEAEAARIMEGRPGLRLAGRHRIGRLVPGDVSLVVAAGAGHRDEAFEACRAMLERIKHDVPIFKKEHYQDGGEEWLVPVGGDHDQQER